jgi:hypothetical protein
MASIWENPEYYSNTIWGTLIPLPCLVVRIVSRFFYLVVRIVFLFLDRPLEFRDKNPLEA